MSLDPAGAALAGLVVLGELLGLLQWVAIGCVAVASIGVTGALEHHRHRRWVTRETTREHEYYILRPTAQETSPHRQWTKAQWMEHFSSGGHTDNAQQPVLQALREGSFLLSRVASGPTARARQSERPAKNA